MQLENIIIGQVFQVCCDVNLSHSWPSLFNFADPDLHKDPAPLRYCLYKWSFLYSLPYLILFFITIFFITSVILP